MQYKKVINKEMINLWFAKNFDWLINSSINTESYFEKYHWQKTLLQKI